MSPSPPSPPSEPELLKALGEAIAAAPGKVVEIEVGIALSIALGRQRPAVSCGGCKTPLDFLGIPTVTNARLSEPFRLRLAEAGS